jgi:DNA-binding FadR family transcriptional regulator
MHQTHEEAEDPYYIVLEHQAILDGICSKESVKALSAFSSHMQSICFNKIRKSANNERLKI